MADQGAVTDLATTGVANLEHWLTDNTELFITYGVNIISALAILLSVTLSLKSSEQCK